MTQYMLIIAIYDKDSKEAETEIIYISDDLPSLCRKAYRVHYDRMDYEHKDHFRIIEFEINFNKFNDIFGLTDFKAIKEYSCELIKGKEGFQLIELK